MLSTELTTEIGCSTIVAVIQKDMTRLAVRYPVDDTRLADYTFTRVRHSRIKHAADALMQGNSSPSADVERVDTYRSGHPRATHRIFWRAFGEMIPRGSKTKAAAFLHEVADRIEELKNG